MSVRMVGWMGAAVLAGAIGLAGCGSANDGPSAQTGSADVSTPEQPTGADQAAVVLPLDGYTVTVPDVETASYAENVLVEKGMNAQNRNWDIGAGHVAGSLQVATRSSGGTRLFDMPIAQKYGYHEPSMYPPDVAAAGQKLNSGRLSVGDRAAWDGCLTSARKTLPPAGYSQIASRLAMETMVAAGAEPDVQHAAGRWRECMAPLGLSDLPAMPDGPSDEKMPPASQAEGLGLNDGGDRPPGEAATSDDTPAPKSPGAAEIKLAVADAACRASSGFTKALYLAQWKHQSEVLIKHAGELARERRLIKDDLAASRKVIADRPEA